MGDGERGWVAQGVSQSRVTREWTGGRGGCGGRIGNKEPGP